MELVWRRFVGEALSDRENDGPAASNALAVATLLGDRLVLKLEQQMLFDPPCPITFVVRLFLYTDAPHVAEGSIVKTVLATSDRKVRPKS